MGGPLYLRGIVEQYTNAELRQRVRYGHGLFLLQPHQAIAWKKMAYGILLERRRAKKDRTAAH